MKTGEDIYGILDADGKTIVECLYHSITLNDEGLYKVEGENGEGLLNSDGAVIIPAEYSVIIPDADGYNVIQNKKEGFLKKDGTVLVAPSYDFMKSNTVNGYIIAANYNDNGDLVYVVIDDTNGVIQQSGFTSEEDAINYCNSYSDDAEGYG